MLSKKNLFALGVGVCTMAFSFGMEDSKRTNNSPIQAPLLGSPQELCAYSNKLLEACEKKDDNSILRLAFPEPSITFEYTPSDHENYLYSRTYALSRTYGRLAQQYNLQSQLAIKNYDNLIKECNNYIEQYGIELAIKIPNFTMLTHLCHIYDRVGHAYFLIANLKNVSEKNHTTLSSFLGSKNTEVTPLFEQSRQAYEHALRCRQEIAQKFSTNDMPSLPDLQYPLTFVYCALAQLNLSGNETLLRNAKASYKSIESSCWTKEELQSASNQITLTETVLTERSRSNSAPKSSKKIEVLKTQNYYKNINKILKEENSNKNNSLADIIRNKHLCLENLNFSVSEPLKYHQVAEEIKKGLLDIETTVSEFLSTTTSSPSKERLEIIYEKLNELLGGAAMINTFWKYITAFIITADLDGGIHRASLLKEIEAKQHGQASYRIRYIVAGIKNLRGDHEEWLSLEAEYQEQERQKKERKTAEKEKREHQRMETLRSSLAQQQKKKLTQQQKKKAELSSPKKVTSSIHASPKETKLQDTEYEPTVREEIGGSYKQEKLEKQKRHEEAEARREQNVGLPKANQEQKDSLLNTHTQPISKEAQLDLILLSSDKTLSELYNLSSGPLAVDQEIEQGTWKFTRDQFKVYIEAMGCVYKDGHGIHAKASLPRATHIMQGDNLVTILNDFGGALTLPSWDKDYVPIYLKPQILKAREKLRALAIKALNYKEEKGQG